MAMEKVDAKYLLCSLYPLQVPFVAVSVFSITVCVGSAAIIERETIITTLPVEVEIKSKRLISLLET